MPTIKEVSELAGVSQATVSRVMNGSDRVTDATRKRVESAMQRLGYRPNSAAQSLASNRTNAIGMVVSELQGPFYGPMMAGVEDVLRRARKHLIIASGHGEEERERDAIEFLINRQVDGLILLVERIEDAELLSLNERVPVFLINHQVNQLHQRTTWLNNELGGYRATRYLIERGHQRIACVTGQMWKQDAQERYQGYRRAMHEAGLTVADDWVIHSFFEFEGGYQAFEPLQQRQLDCTAIFASNDEMAFGVLEAADNHNVAVPDQLSVIGFDNIYTANYVKPKLTTMNFPMYEMARSSAENALAAVYQKRPIQEVVFEPTLVERETVRRL